MLLSPAAPYACAAQVLGSAVIRRTRGSLVTLRTETGLSSCSTLMADEALASYSWSLLEANETRFGEVVTVEVGRDPRVLVIPPYTLGFAGSSYLFQFRSAIGGENATTANALGECSMMLISIQPRRVISSSRILLLGHVPPTVSPREFPIFQPKGDLEPPGAFAIA